MSKDEDVLVSRRVTKFRMEFWASMMDAYLQDFMAKAEANDALGSILAAARLAQLGAAIKEEFLANVEVLTQSETERKAAQEACSKTVETINRNSDECRKMRDSTELVDKLLS